MFLTSFPIRNHEEQHFSWGNAVNMGVKIAAFCLLSTMIFSSFVKGQSHNNGTSPSQTTTLVTTKPTTNGRPSKVESKMSSTRITATTKQNSASSTTTSKAPPTTPRSETKPTTTNTTKKPDELCQNRNKSCSYCTDDSSCFYCGSDKTCRKYDKSKVIPRHCSGNHWYWRQCKIPGKNTYYRGLTPSLRLITVGCKKFRRLHFLRQFAIHRILPFRTSSRRANYASGILCLGKIRLKS